MKRQPKEKKKHEVLHLVLRVLLLAMIAGVIFFTTKGVTYVKQVISEAPSIEDVDFTPKGFASYTYDTDDNIVQELVSADANRVAVSINQVPDTMKQAIVDIEDERFYQHNGVDLKGIIRAGIKGIKNKGQFTQGASTITQQLLKNNVFEGWLEEQTLKDRITRKIQEQYLAICLERELQDKDLILENYLNTINFGAGTYGVASATEKYFGKSVENLTLSESAVLAAIPQNPSRYNPIRFPEENKGRRDYVLQKMFELGDINEKQYQDALDDDVYERIVNTQKKSANKETVYSYFTDALVKQVISDLQEQKGYSEDDAYRLVYSGGLQIYTTQDKNVQTICDGEYANPKNFPETLAYSVEWSMTVAHKNGESEWFNTNNLADFAHENGVDITSLKNKDDGNDLIKKYKEKILLDGDTAANEQLQYIPQPQSSVVVMDQSTGYVKAIVGGRGEKTGSLTLNRATSTTRQPGSTFKILSAYAEAIDSGKMMIGSLVDDSPFNYKNKTPVRNADGQYRGMINIRDAIRDSVNVVAVKVLTNMSEQKCLNRVEKFGILTLDYDKDKTQALALGGITNGVTNLELTAAYAALANDGEYIKPVLYTKILDHEGNVLLSNVSEHHTAVSDATAWILTDAMKDVVENGTGIDAKLKNDIPAVGKTGTTSDSRDLWFVGYTPYYTMGIWSGCDNNYSLPDEGAYKNFHTKLWSAIMTRLTEKKEVVDFEQPNSVVRMKLCGISAKLPTSDCEHVVDDYIAKWYIPTEDCPSCKW